MASGSKTQATNKPITSNIVTGSPGAGKKDGFVKPPKPRGSNKTQPRA